MQLNKLKKNSKGFTLIELLIVIIIIGILAAIAFVAYSGSQNKAKKADAQATLAEVKNKLAEYNADKGNYPATQAELNTWMGTNEGGNNDTLAAKFVDPNFDYVANDGAATPGTCDNTATPCTGFTITADQALFGGSADIEIKN